MGYRPSPPRLLSKRGVRRVYWSGHQECWEAYWHAWTTTFRDGHLVVAAVLENDDGGTIRIEDRIGGLEFIDPIEQ